MQSILHHSFTCYLFCLARSSSYSSAPSTSLPYVSQPSLPNQVYKNQQQEQQTSAQPTMPPQPQQQPRQQVVYDATQQNKQYSTYADQSATQPYPNEYALQQGPSQAPPQPPLQQPYMPDVQYPAAGYNSESSNYPAMYPPQQAYQAVNSSAPPTARYPQASQSYRAQSTGYQPYQ